jgi:hypothetical protein
VRSVLKLAARAAVWRTTAEPQLIGLRVLLGISILTAAVRILLQLAAAFPSHAFNPYGLNAVVAWIALELAVAALFVRPGARVTALSAMFILSVVADLVTSAIRLGFPLLAPDMAEGPIWSSPITGAVIFIIAVGWWVGAMACVIGSFEEQSRLRALGTAAAIWVALFAANAIVPHAPVFVPPDFDARDANWWEVAHAYYREKYGEPVPPQVAQIEKAQSGLLKAEIARLAPRKDATNVYALGIAGWAEQDVFIKELDGGLDIASVLPIKDRTVKLINNRATLGTAPFADPQNFTAAVHAIAGVMNKDQDVLVLFTDATHTSFGCAPERDWTYFGDAFFRQSLHPGADFAQAFGHARVLIQGWEMMDHDPPSNPQAHFGPALVDKLAPFFAAAQNAGQ